ncbi:hypothetical protein EW146_g10444 [Bondarzewia mesenterica]|uniref:HPP transmembrane region domain-containing protein n=1 Tax=Bondarzewia mesenterica TaxID=1095465 RepID=A0A4S4KX45_9AGAM|nr:hypothetical protein EW146_g10444 [Bondarzewia mesenterica]
MNPPPASRLSRLPLWLSRWLGYRPSPPPKRPEYIVWFWSWVGAFCGLSVIMAVFGQAHYFIERNVPLLVASYGASAVLIYGAIEAPLAQPRALVGGHFLGALIGVCIMKLFHLLPTEERFDQLRWLSAALSCSTAIVVMQITDWMVLSARGAAIVGVGVGSRVAVEQRPEAVSRVLVYTSGTGCKQA